MLTHTDSNMHTPQSFSRGKCRWTLAIIPTHTLAHMHTYIHTHMDTHGVRTATNVVTSNSLYGLRSSATWALCRGITSRCVDNFFLGAGLRTHRQYHWCGVGTQSPMWTPPISHGTVDGTDVFALFCHPSQSQIPFIHLGMLEQWDK